MSVYAIVALSTSQARLSFVALCLCGNFGVRGVGFCIGGVVERKEGVVIFDKLPNEEMRTKAEQFSLHLREVLTGIMSGIEASRVFSRTSIEAVNSVKPAVQELKLLSNPKLLARYRRYCEFVLGKERANLLVDSNPPNRL